MTSLWLTGTRAQLTGGMPRPSTSNVSLEMCIEIVRQDNNTGLLNQRVKRQDICMLAGEMLTHLEKRKTSTRMGFEPTRAEPNGLAVHRLNHSATSSSVVCLIVVV